MGLALGWALLIQTQNARMSELVLGNSDLLLISAAIFVDIDDDFEITVDSELDLDVTLGLDNGLASTGTSDLNP